MYKEKAQEIVDQYKPFVYCFLGSGMLVNQENEGVILKNAQECAKIDVKNTIDALENYDEMTEKYLEEEFDTEYISCELQNMDGDFRYWSKVYKAIEETV